MTDITIFVDEKRYEKLLENGFDSSLGPYFHNIAVMCMAYDTGNARSAISLSKNTSRHIQINYNLLKANYIQFLEKGQGPVKKHKGIISVITVGSIAEQTIGWLLSGVSPTFTSPPVVALRTSQYKPFNVKSTKTGLNERDMLKQAGMYDKSISAQARQEVSKIREYTYRTMFGGRIVQQRGDRVETTTLKGSKRPYGDKNIGILRNIVRDRKQEYLKNRQEALDLINLKLE